jgi:hypothetical protein
MRSISIKQPHAERIAAGSQRIEHRSWRAPSLVGHDILIVASKSTMKGYAGEPRGVTVCVVHVVRMAGERGDYRWHVENPRRVKPFEVKGSRGIFRVPDGKIRYAKPRKAAV